MFIENQDEPTVCISGIRLRNCYSSMSCHIALLKDSFITILFTLTPLGDRTVPLPLEPMHSTCQWEPGLALLLCLAFNRMGRRAESSKPVSCHSQRAVGFPMSESRRNPTLRGDSGTWLETQHSRGSRVVPGLDNSFCSAHPSNQAWAEGRR